MKREIFILCILPILLFQSSSIQSQSNTINIDEWEGVSSYAGDGNHCVVPNQDTVMSDQWAIIVAPPDTNHGPSDEGYYRFSDQAENLYSLLCGYGWQEDHISMLTLEDATYSNVLDAYEWLARNDKPADTVLIVMLSHGGSGKIMLTSFHSSYKYEEMDGHLEILEAQNIIVCISACYSGSAIPYLKHDNRIIITSSRSDEACTTRFFDALLNGFDGLGDTIGDMNRVVSVEEAFSLAKEDSVEDDWFFHPQIADWITGSSHLIFLRKSDGIVDQMTNAPRHTAGITTMGVSHLQSAQSFTPSSNFLSKIQIPIRSMISPNEPLYVSIRDQLDGADLVSCVIDPDDVAYLWGRYHTIDFPDVSVTPGSTYYIVCSTTDAGHWRWYASNAPEKDLYPLGCMYECSDLGWVEYDCCDLLFATYSNLQGNTKPLIPMRSHGPSYGFKDISYSFNFSTVDGENDQISYCVDWGDGSQTWTSFYPSDVSVTVAHRWSRSGQYQIRVKAKDEQGLESDWSDSSYIIIGSNHVPKAPVISGPMGVKRHETNTFYLQSEDLDGDSLYYYVYWGYGSTSGWLGPYDPGEEVAISHSWSWFGDMSVWVKTRDEKGWESPWSSYSVHVFPEMIIKKPLRGVYIANIVIGITKNEPPIVIGPIDVTLDTSYTEYFSSAEFYVDGKMVHSVSSGPYVWQWNRLGFGSKELKIVLYDEVGVSTDYIKDVWKFL